MAGNEYAVQVVWVEGLQFVARGLESESAFVLDGSVDSGGLGHGMRPTEVLLCAMAGCSAMDVIHILRKMRQQVTGLSVNVLGIRGEEYPRPVQTATVEYVVHGTDLSEGAVSRAIELSEQKYCGVMNTLKTEIKTSYRIEAE